MTARVGLVLVAHASALARGAREVARQMAADVDIEAVGGFVVDGVETLGTDVDRVRAAIERLLARGREVVVLGDLGSALITAELVVELLDDGARVRVVHGPFVEGAVAAGVAAAGGAGLEEVAEVVRRAAEQWDTTSPAPPAAPAPPADDVTRVVLGNTTGLHARPAAILATLVAGLDAQVLVNGAPADSIFELMKLAIGGGEELELRVSGPGAQEARAAVTAAIESGLGER